MNRIGNATTRPRSAAAGGTEEAVKDGAAVETRVRAMTAAIRVILVPLAVEAVLSGELADTAVVAVATAVALAPLVIERAGGSSVHPIVHMAVAVIAVVEAAGRTLELYEGNPVPFDLAAHALEMGAAVALVLVAVGRWWPRRMRGLVSVLAGAIAALLLGVGWEVVESVLDPMLSGTLQHGFEDTASDVAAGVIGGGLAGFLVPRYPRSPHGNTATAALNGGPGLG